MEKSVEADGSFEAPLQAKRSRRARTLHPTPLDGRPSVDAAVAALPLLPPLPSLMRHPLPTAHQRAGDRAVVVRGCLRAQMSASHGHQLLDPHGSPPRYHSTDSTPRLSRQPMTQPQSLPPAPPPLPGAASAAEREPPFSSAADSAPALRPLEEVVPPSAAKEREELERQREWRTARWNELHWHHKESLAIELERRILLLIWITVELVHATQPQRDTPPLTELLAPPATDCGLPVT